MALRLIPGAEDETDEGGNTDDGCDSKMATDGCEENKENEAMVICSQPVAGPDPLPAPVPQQQPEAASSSSSTSEKQSAVKKKKKKSLDAAPVPSPMSVE